MVEIEERCPDQFTMAQAARVLTFQVLANSYARCVIEFYMWLG